MVDVRNTLAVGAAYVVAAIFLVLLCVCAVVAYPVFTLLLLLFGRRPGESVWQHVKLSFGWPLTALDNVLRHVKDRELDHGYSLEARF